MRLTGGVFGRYDVDSARKAGEGTAKIVCGYGAHYREIYLIEKQLAKSLPLIIDGE